MLILACLPIGDSRDASAHLIQSIQQVQYVAAEDSRKFARLCQDLNIKHNAKVISFFEGNESEKIEELTNLLKSQKDVLVATDAGAPGISDPGYRLIRAAAGAAFGLDRSGAICREMSKHYEEVVRGSIAELITWAKSKEILGEITVVLAGFDPASRQIADEDLIKMVLELEEIGESRKEAIAQVAKKYAVAKRVVFDAMVTYKSEDKI